MSLQYGVLSYVYYSAQLYGSFRGRVVFHVEYLASASATRHATATLWHCRVRLSSAPLTFRLSSNLRADFHSLVQEAGKCLPSKAPFLHPWIVAHHFDVFEHAVDGSDRKLGDVHRKLSVGRLLALQVHLPCVLPTSWWTRSWPGSSAGCRFGCTSFHGALMSCCQTIQSATFPAFCQSILPI